MISSRGSGKGIWSFKYNKAQLLTDSSKKDSMIDYNYSRTETLIEALKANEGERLCAALLEEESSFSMHVLRYLGGRIILDEGRAFTEEEFLEEYECRYWVVR